MAYFFSIKVKMFSNLGPYIFPVFYLDLWLKGWGRGTVGVAPFLGTRKGLAIIPLMFKYSLVLLTVPHILFDFTAFTLSIKYGFTLTTSLPSPSPNASVNPFINTGNPSLLILLALPTLQIYWRC